MKRPSSDRWWLVVISALALFTAGCHLIVTHTTLAIDPVGARVYVRESRSEFVGIRVVDARLHQTIARIPLDVVPDGLAVNPSNGELYAAGGGSILVIDTSTGQVLATILVGAEIEALALNTPGTRLFVLHGHPDGISVIDTSARRVVKTLEIESPSAMVAAPALDHLYLAQYFAGSGKGVGDSTLSLLDTNGSAVIASTTFETLLPLGLALDPTGSRLYVAGITGKDENSLAGRCFVLETGGLRTMASVPAGLFPVAVAVNPTGTRAYVVDSRSATLMVMATSNNALLETVAVREEPVAVVVNPSGTEVYVSHNDGTLTVVNAATNGVIGENRP